MLTRTLGTHRSSGKRHSLIDLLFLWQERAAMRRALQNLDDHALKDIGLSRGQISQELRKPFWLA